MSNFTPITRCPGCSELKKYVDQQAELISQLMKIIGQTHEKLVVLDKRVQEISSLEHMLYTYSVSESPNSSTHSEID
ncbi:hypothetical protein E3U55_02380 [Filobacillus milosensis]|uniref:Uncharacterized protein n=1 Tax=Filobacillus milosensis TaxID=94137 RepID=A0A4Y8IVN2_9BACI|nr:hypothetical protein [Filobacillus milosensis]TFB24368.1 hypothetical protein E3U55_02380 [Filobacillus milosensis]